MFRRDSHCIGHKRQPSVDCAGLDAEYGEPGPRGGLRNDLSENIISIHDRSASRLSIAPSPLSTQPVKSLYRSIYFLPVPALRPFSIDGSADRG
jgi:hypothetical protein